MTGMTDRRDGTAEDDRRSFASRTPANANPDQVTYRRGFVTRHQVSGWRFVMRRIAAGVALHDTRMLVEPLRTQARAVLMGVLVLATAAAGCFVFTLIWPSGSAGNDPVLADKSTAALYVRLGDELHPVLNLTSARLIVGRPVNPTTVKSPALDKFPRGNLVGIPGAPERMVQSAGRDADWTVCEGIAGPAAGVTVIAGPPDSGGARAAVLEPQHAVLASNGADDWLLWNGKRSRIDLADRAITTALGLGTEVARPRPISAGLFNAIPESPALTAPVIADAGQPPNFDLPVAAPVGAVVEAFALNEPSATAMRYYAVLPDGLQPISGVLAAVLRNTDSHGLDRPPRLGADDIAKLPVSRALDTARYPDGQITLADPVRNPISCAHWSKPAGASTSSLTLLAGSALPLPESAHTLDLVGAATGSTAHRVALAPGTGYFVQSVGGHPTADSAGSLFWVSDTGVRFGLDTETDTAVGGQPKTVSALGLQQPALPIPWAVLSLLAPGPALSRGDALLAHDGLAPDQRPGRRAVTANVGETR